MSDTVIKVENISKQYHLGVIGSGTLAQDINRFWAKVKGKEDPTLKISAVNKINTIDSEYIWALKNINFEVKKGEVLGIIGKNGAGKSTLLKILSRVTAPTTGKIKIKGRIASLLEVGTGFHKELTGRENIFLNGAILGMTKSEIKSKLDEIIDFSGIEKYIDTPVKRYSSGMYVRLAFAVAAHMEPEILIVDEVLSVGDAEFQKKALGKMQNVTNIEGRTVLFVSHNMSSVQNLCKSAILLKQGEIAYTGNPEDVISHYLSKNINDSFFWKTETKPLKDIYFKQVYLSDYSGNKLKYVTTASDIAVIMDYYIGNNFTDLQISGGLLDLSGTVIFSSSPQDSGLKQPQSIGNHRIIWFLPNEIFMPDKTYRIKTVLWLPNGGTIDSYDNLQFTCHEAPCLANSTPGGRKGLITIRCKWEMKN